MEEEGETDTEAATSVAEQTIPRDSYTNMYDSQINTQPLGWAIFQYCHYYDGIHDNQSHQAFMDMRYMYCDANNIDH